MKHTIITISRQYGSGGRTIGHLVADGLGIQCYDRSIIDKAAKLSELSPDFIKRNEQHLSNSFIFDTHMASQIYKAEAEVIKECAQKGSCVIVGRCADKILERDFLCLKVFLYADFDIRCQRAVSMYGKNSENIRSYVKKVDRGRDLFFRRFHDCERNNMSNYNLCLDTGLLKEQNTAEIIKQTYLIISGEETI